MTTATGAAVPALYFRDGSKFTGRATFERAGVFTADVVRKCHRCGGAGGHEQWRHTGFTCFECNGIGTLGTKAIKLYTADKLAKLNATKAKADTKRADKKAAAAAEREREAACRRAMFETENADLLARARKITTDRTLADIVERATLAGFWSANQASFARSLTERAEAAAASAASSTWIGTVGERLEVAVTVGRVGTFERTGFGYYAGTETVYVVTMIDAAGNQIVSKSPRFAPEVGESFTIRATVKGHDEYKGAKQTTVERVKVQNGDHE